ncbi:hypothetical protein FN846DRAFT_73933 [Sphaerosporella brunnea]|uniref:Uncharacterized protein n=1 Tax=Sphaerosporella brunnea TaxID=1250544 RepID=A0A5J5ETN3_9PEZI|nr:hypothetical protein FN846DRAFT_73933 [Sphaerosporella brunnea]
MSEISPASTVHTEPDSTAITSTVAKAPTIGARTGDWLLQLPSSAASASDVLTRTEYLAVVPQLVTRPTANLSVQQCISILLDPTWSAIEQLAIHMSPDKAIAEALTAIDDEYVGLYCATYAESELAAEVTRDALAVEVAIRHEQAIQISPEYRKQIGKRPEITDFFEKAKRRNRSEAERRAGDFTWIAQHWGQDWQEKLELGGELKFNYSQKSRELIRKALKVGTGTAQLFGEFVKKELDLRLARQATGTIHGGARSTLACPVDLRAALTQWKSIRLSKTITPTPQKSQQAWFDTTPTSSTPYRLITGTDEIHQEVSGSDPLPPEQFLGPPENDAQQAADEASEETPTKPPSNLSSYEWTKDVWKDTGNSVSDNEMPAEPTDTTTFEVLQDTETAKDSDDELEQEHAQSDSDAEQAIQLPQTGSKTARKQPAREPAAPAQTEHDGSSSDDEEEDLQRPRPSPSTVGDGAYRPSRSRAKSIFQEASNHEEVENSSSAPIVDSVPDKDEVASLSLDVFLFLFLFLFVFTILL